MVSFDNRFGTIYLGENYFNQLVTKTVKNSFGVAGLASHKRPFFNKKTIKDSVKVINENGKLKVEIHIKMSYGLNLAATARSISHKIKYVIEDTTGFVVSNIDVYIENITA